MVDIKIGGGISLWGHHKFVGMYMARGKGGGSGAHGEGGFCFGVWFFKITKCQTKNFTRQ